MPWLLLGVMLWARVTCSMVGWYDGPKCERAIVAPDGDPSARLVFDAPEDANLEGLCDRLLDEPIWVLGEDGNTAIGLLPTASFGIGVSSINLRLAQRYAQLGSDARTRPLLDDIRLHSLMYASEVAAPLTEQMAWALAVLEHYGVDRRAVDDWHLDFYGRTISDRTASLALLQVKYDPEAVRLSLEELDRAAREAVAEVQPQ